jgi:hypothetical protein
MRLDDRMGPGPVSEWKLYLSVELVIDRLTRLVTSSSCYGLRWEPDKQVCDRVTGHFQPCIPVNIPVNRSVFASKVVGKSVRSWGLRLR